MAEIPSPDIPIPSRVRELARGARLTPVWINDLGGLTFRATDADSIRFIKYEAHNPEWSVEAEVERLRWVAPFTPVPRVIEFGRNETHAWLVTEGLAGESAVSPRWRSDPATAVRAIGQGLRALHDALPVAQCPFRWDVPGRLATAAARGIRVPAALHEPPPVDRLVVCHGDACAPNTLISDAGTWSGHVDLGSLGIGDRWGDLASAALSTQWNYGPGWEDALVDAYGIDPDPERMQYYQALWNAT